MASAPARRVRVLRIPLDVVATDFLYHHGGDPATTPKPTHDGVLRQPSLPDGATVAYARVEDPAAGAQRERLQAYVAALRDALADAGLPVPDPPPHDARVLPAALVVAVESARWKPVAVGEEPEHDAPPTYAHFGWPTEGEGDGA